MQLSAWSALALKPLPLSLVASSRLFWHFNISGGLRVRMLFTATRSARFELSAAKWHTVLIAIVLLSRFINDLVKA